MQEVEAIFFDVDGTLVDSKDDIADAVNYALRSAGLPGRPAAEICRLIGTGTRDLIRKSLGAGNTGRIDEVLSVFSGYYAAHSAVKTVLYPHVRRTLDHFKDKKKYILTNRYTRFAVMTLELMGIRGYFEDIIGGDDEKRLKPSPVAIDEAIEKDLLDRGRVLIVGDMAVDILAGKNAGIKTCWVTYGLGRAEDVMPLNPDLVVDDLSQLERSIG